MQVDLKRCFNFLRIASLVLSSQLLVSSVFGQSLPALGNPQTVGGTQISTVGFFAGATNNGGSSFSSVFQQRDDILVQVEVVTETSHQGSSGKIYVVAVIGDTNFTFFESGGWVEWDGTIAGLGGARIVASFTALNQLNVSGIVDLVSGEGTVRVALYIGYDTLANSEEIYYSGNPLQFTIEAEGQKAEALALFESELATQVVQTRCIVCHVQGGLGRDTALVFQRTNIASTKNNFEVFRSLVADRTDAVSYILSKVSGGNHVGGIQLAAGSAEYNTLSDFLSLLNSSSPSSTSNNFFTGITLQSNEETLRRAAIILAGRAPTDAEIAAVRNGSDNDLRTTLRNLMQGEVFHEFLLEGTNDRLLVEGVIGLIIDGNTDQRYPKFVNEMYRLNVLGEEIGDDSSSGLFNQGIQNALSRAPGELVAYIAENDRSYEEVVTADYMMMNPLTNFILGGNAQFDNPDNLFEFQPGRTSEYYLDNDTLIYEPEVAVFGTRVLDPGDLRVDYPHAGILNTPAFLHRYPTTSTNRNRARARWTFLRFLDIDIERSSQRPTDPAALADKDNPTLKNPSCTACHATMDPVAGAFQNYDDVNNYRGQPDGLDSLDGNYKYPEDGSPTLYQYGDTWYRDMRSPGLFDTEIHDDEASLQALAQLIVKEPGFARASVKFWWPSIIGSKILFAPAVEEDNDYQAQMQAYEAQSASISRLADEFSTNFNLKDLLVDLMMSPWFRAAASTNTTLQAAHEAAELGRERLLTPERLERKTRALTGFTWRSYEGHQGVLYTGLGGEYLMFYGGIDSIGITERAIDLTPLMSTVAMTHALESACPIVLREFILPDEVRKLFSGIDEFTSPLSEKGLSVELESADQNDFREYSLNLKLFTGSKELRIEYINDYCDFDATGDCITDRDRNVIVDYISIQPPGSNVPEVVQATESNIIAENCGGPQPNENWIMNCGGAIRFSFTAEVAGDYIIKVRLSASRAGDELAKVTIVVKSIVDAYQSQSAGAVAIRAKIVELHQKLLGKSYSIDSPEITNTYTLFVDSWLDRQARELEANLFRWPDSTCNWQQDFNFFDDLGFPGEVRRFNEEYNFIDFNYDEINPFLNQFSVDPLYVKQSWITVLVYLMTHYDYLYE